MNDLAKSFLDELESFRLNVESGFLCLQANVSANELALNDSGVARRAGEAALFWNAMQCSLQASAFLSLGRMFDQSSPHNIDRLIRIAQEDANLFSADSLRARKIADSTNSQQWIAHYMTSTYVPVARDFRRMRRYVKKYRAVYVDRFRDARNLVYAHTAVIDKAGKDAIFSKADVLVFLRVLMFLSCLHSSLWEMFHNGRKPQLWCRRYSSAASVGSIKSHIFIEAPLARRMREAAKNFLCGV